MTNPNYRALCAEHLPELRGMFERILCIARSSDDFTIGNIQLVDRLINAVVSWSENSLAQPEPAPTDEELEQLLFDDHRSAIEFACDTKAEGDIVINNHIDFARAVLAKWGTPANTINQDKLDRLMALNADDGEPIVLPNSSAPKPVAPTTAELKQLWAACNSPSVFARAVLARWGTPANTINQEDYDCCTIQCEQIRAELLAIAAELDNISRLRSDHH